MLKFLLLCAAAAAAVSESPLKAFDPRVLLEAQGAGRPVLIQVASQFCEVCAFQRETLDQLAAQSTPFKEILYLKLTMDRPESADVMRALNFPGRGTLVLLRGTRELGRLVGTARPEDIRKLLEKAIPSGRSGARSIRPKNRVKPRP